MRRIEVNTVRIVLGLALGLLAAGAFAACSPAAPDQAEIVTKFEEVLEPARKCDEVEEVSPCVLVYPGCPLGQFAAVHRDRAAEVDEAARALLRQYALKDQVCAYQGTDVTAPDVECFEGKCRTFERPAPPTPDAGD
jgi:hypothetical protein